jgi:hypothetical protein
MECAEHFASVGRGQSFGGAEKIGECVLLSKIRSRKISNRFRIAYRQSRLHAACHRVRVQIPESASKTGSVSDTAA